MFGSKAFCGLTKSQNEIVRYWRSICSPGELPARDCLDPGALRAYLSAISMIQVGADGAFRFRLVGSGLRAVFGRDVGGQVLGSLTGASADMFSLGLEATIERQAPVGGITGRANEQQAWLRLPFAGAPGEGMVILCHDELLRQRVETGSQGQWSSTLSHSESGIAA